MTYVIDQSVQSFVEIAENSHFPIQNLPYGVFSGENDNDKRIGVAIGNLVLDLTKLERSGFFKSVTGSDEPIFQAGTLNEFMSRGRIVWTEVRKILVDCLRDDTPLLRDDPVLCESVFFEQNEVRMHLPADIGDYTDFYSSKEHATNVGIMFRGKENALMPNWLHLPVAYHGRSSSVAISGTDVVRPRGQVLPPDQDAPVYSASKLMDFELEMGFFTGPGNPPGEPVDVKNAVDSIFGMVLVNDWSARDLQKWEYQPLGPFLGKNFATSISPWVVTMDALEPFRVVGPVQDPAPLAYLKEDDNFAYDVNLEVFIQSEKMADRERVCSSNLKYMYWSICQQLAHHTVNGCNMRPGDLLASGTISGPVPESFGSMLELSWRGTKPLKFSNGEERKFLQDGDRVVMSGFCKKDKFQIGFGEVEGKLLPAKQ